MFPFWRTFVNFRGVCPFSCIQVLFLRETHTQVLVRIRDFPEAFHDRGMGFFDHQSYSGVRGSGFLMEKKCFLFAFLSSMKPSWAFHFFIFFPQGLGFASLIFENDICIRIYSLFFCKLLQYWKFSVGWNNSSSSSPSGKIFDAHAWKHFDFTPIESCARGLEGFREQRAFFCGILSRSISGA